MNVDSLLSPRTRRSALIAIAFLASRPAAAIDNPDAPDEVAAFEARCQPLEKRVVEASGAELVAAQTAYAQFLERELNTAYQHLLRVVDSEPRQAMVLSQRRWLAFRDAETRFIIGNWVAQRFGTSSAMSRAEYSATLVRQRVLVLLAYVQNYAPEKR